VKRLSPVVVYTSSRLVLFIVTATILALAGMKGVLLLLVALLASGLLSYVLLSKQRDAMSAAVVARASRGETPRQAGRFSSLRNRLEERTRAEDEADEAARADEDPPTAG
jgi:hypothetical protein